MKLGLAVLGAILSFASQPFAETWIARPVEKVGMNQAYLYGEWAIGYVHKGVDFIVPSGTDVIAYFSGIVTYTEKNDPENTYHYKQEGREKDDKGNNIYRLGNYARIQTRFRGEDLYIDFGHLDTVLINKDDHTVTAGTLAGTSDNSGYSTQPHLHVAVWNYQDKKRRFINPELVFTPSSRDRGVIVGRAVDNKGNALPPLTRININPNPKSTSGYGFALVYGLGATPSPWFNENYCIGDIPPGQYVVSNNDKSYQITVEVRAGAIVDVTNPTNVKYINLDWPVIAPSGNDHPFPPFTFHKEQGKADVYLAYKDGRLWPILSAEVLFAWTGKPNDFGMVKEYPAGTLDRYRRGPIIGKTNSLYKDKRPGSDYSAVYLVTSDQHSKNVSGETVFGRIRPIRDEETFRFAGFSWDNVLEVDESFLNRYTRGPLFTLIDISIAYHDNSDDPGQVHIAGGVGGEPLDQSGPSIITTIAGTGGAGFSGDGGPATQASFFLPSGVAADTKGNVYVADFDNHRIRRIRPDGIITTFAGNGNKGFSGDGGPATQAKLNRPNGVAVDAQGIVYIADQENNRIRRVDTNGIIRTLAGTGENGFSEDGIPAVQASIIWPSKVTVDANGVVYFSDGHRVRRVGSDGIIRTVAGTRSDGFSGDGGAGIQASLRYPEGVAVDSKGNVYIADRSNHRVRRVSPGGIITTFAGTGEEGSSGDGGPATQASLKNPVDVVVDAKDNVYIADWLDHRIRRVSPDGIITTFAGSIAGYSGDGGPPDKAMLNIPYGVAVDVKGVIYIADRWNQRVRRIGPQLLPITLISPTSLSFGDMQVDQNKQLMFTIGNTGNASLTVSGISVSGTDATQFSVSPATTTVAAGAIQNVTVIFTPTSAGSKSASLSIAHNASGSPSSVSLTGNGIAAQTPGITLSTPSLAFDAVAVGQSSQRTFTVTNSGNASLSVTSITIGGTDPSQFTVSPTTATIAAGQSQTITVTFTPSSLGVKSASLSISHNAAGSPSSITMVGNGTTLPVPGIDILSSSLDFASVTVGQSGTQTFVVTNTGRAPLILSSMTVSGADASQFRVSPDTATVSAGRSRSISVTFAPSSPGTKTASLSIVHNAPGSPTTLTLRGEAQGAPSITLSTQSLSFGNVRTTTSKSLSFTVGNSGNVALTVSSISVTGADAGMFSMTPSSLSVNPGEAAKTVTVIFSPSAGSESAIPKSASVSLAHNGTGGPATMSLTGTATAPAIAVSPPSLSFGNMTVGQSKSLALTIKNTGTDTLFINSVGISGADATQFPLTTGQVIPLYIILPNGIQTISLPFTPTVIGSKTATLTLNHNPAPTAIATTVAVTGTAITFPPPTLNPATLAFGNVRVGQNKPLTLRVNNSDSSAAVPVTGITANDSAFRISRTALNLPAKGSDTTTVIFTPTNREPKSATLTLTYNAGAGSAVVTATMTGQGTEPVINLSPADTLRFGEVKVGQNALLTFTVGNGGNEPLMVSSIARVGADSVQFTVNPTAFTVNAGAAAQRVTVTFAPVSGGAKTIGLSLSHNATGSPTTLALSGTGVASGPLMPKAGDGTGKLAAGDRKVQVLGSVKPGQKVDVSISFNQELVGATGLQATLKFDPKKLSVVDGKGDGVFANALFPGPPQVKDNTVMYAGAFLGQTITAKGPLAILTFQTLSDFSGETDILLTALNIIMPGLRKDFSPQASVVLTSEAIAGSAPAPDFDGDGEVGFNDFFAFAGAFGEKAAGDNAKFDLDGDGEVGFGDFFAFAAEFGKKLGSTSPGGTPGPTTPPTGGVPPPPPPVAFGHLQVNANVAGSQVYVDGVKRGETSPGTPLNLENVGLGEVEVRVEANGYQSVTKKVTLESNKWTQVVVALQPVSSPGPSITGQTVKGMVYYSNTPLYGVRVDLIAGDISNPPVQTTASSSAGVYEFRGVQPGKYQLKAYGPTSEYAGWVASQITVSDSPVTFDLYVPKTLKLISPANNDTVNSLRPFLLWVPITEATTYTVQINVTATWQLAAWPKGLTTNYYQVFPDLLPGTEYTWMVDAYDAQGHRVAYSAAIMEFHFTTPKTPSGGSSGASPPPSPTFQTGERRFEVLSIFKFNQTEETGYHVRESATNKENILHIPSDARITGGSRSDIKVGTIITVTRWMNVANGVVATELSVAVRR